MLKLTKNFALIQLAETQVAGSGGQQTVRKIEKKVEIVAQSWEVLKMEQEEAKHVASMSDDESDDSEP